MQAAQAANRICLAITLPKSKCDVSPKHGLSLPNLSAEFGHNGPEFGPDSSKLAWQQQEPNTEPFDCRNKPVPSRFRDPEQGANGGDETISADPRSFPETLAPYVLVHVTKGLDHVGIGPEPHLPRVPQARPSRHFNVGRKAMTEVVTALLAFISIGIFLAHAFDAYRLR